jgi:hypothetical protein
LKDLSGWIQVGLAVISLVVGLALVRMERNNKRLSYAILSNRAIMYKPTALDIEVHHDGTLIKNPWLVVWRLANGGTSPIESSHFEEPISLRVTGAEILTAEVTHTRPASFDPQVERIESDRVALDKRLINSWDMLEVQMLLDGEPSGFDVEARITGISEIKRGRVPVTSWNEPWKFTWIDKGINVLMLAMITGIAAGLIFNGTGRWTPYVGIVLAFVGLVLGPWYTWRRNRNNKLFLG